MSETIDNSKSRSNVHWKKEDDVFGRITWALILIGAGILFLLNTTGILPWSFWGTFWSIAWRFWPLLLVFAGIQIIAGKNKIVSVLLNIIFLLTAIGITLITVGVTIPNSPFKESFDNFISNLKISKGELISKVLEVNKDQYSDVELRNISINTTHGKLALTDNDEQDDYLVLNAEYYENRGVPKLESGLNNSELNMFVKTESDLGLLFDFFEDETVYNFEFGNTSLPTNFDLQFTSGEGNANFSSLKVRAFNLAMTSGNFNLNFADSSVPNEINAKLTSGNLKIILPKGIGIKVVYAMTSGSVSVDGDELNGRNGIFEINEDAEDVVNIDLNLTSGNVDIVFD